MAYMKSEIPPHHPDYNPMPETDSFPLSEHFWEFVTGKPVTPRYTFHKGYHHHYHGCGHYGGWHKTPEVPLPAAFPLLLSAIVALVVARRVRG